MNPTGHKRRVRYKGKNPRNFHEKYKELDPEKYKADQEKIKLRGATPVGTHRPICINEILKILNPSPNEILLDATLGYGGHSSALLAQMQPHGCLIGLDQDSIEQPKTIERIKKIETNSCSLIFGNINFRQAKKFIEQAGYPKVDMIIADLGISSMQLDDPQRGFSYKTDAPLDLRMNPSVGISVADLLKKINHEDLTQLIVDNSDEPRAKVFAKAILDKKPNTTLELTNIIREVQKNFSKSVQEKEKDLPIRRIFQALRIAVNDELNSLDQFLFDIPSMLRPGGRVAILSFHSGEDRRVKKSFQYFFREKTYSSIADSFIRPSSEEQRGNPRSKSAKLRWAIL
jgi:16S rRNA (cytosine1402-N4)-methyltransferase